MDIGMLPHLKPHSSNVLTLQARLSYTHKYEFNHSFSMIYFLSYGPNRLRGQEGLIVMSHSFVREKRARCMHENSILGQRLSRPLATSFPL